MSNAKTSEMRTFDIPEGSVSRVELADQLLMFATVIDLMLNPDVQAVAAVVTNFRCFRKRR